jgi:hypothetical protein
MDAEKQPRTQDVLIKLQELLDRSSTDGPETSALLLQQQQHYLNELEECLERKRERMRTLRRKRDRYKADKAQRKERKKRKSEQSRLRERWESQRRSDWVPDKDDDDDDDKERAKDGKSDGGTNDRETKDGSGDDEEDDSDDGDEADTVCAECKDTTHEHECAKCEKPVCDSCTDGFGESPWMYLEAMNVWMCPDCAQDAAMLHLGQRIKYMECENGGLAKLTLGPSFW